MFDVCTELVIDFELDAVIKKTSVGTAMRFQDFYVLFHLLTKSCSAFLIDLAQLATHINHEFLGELEVSK